MQSSLSANAQTEPAAAQASLYDQLGGRECLERVHRRFYDKIFNHPNFAAFFDGKNRQHQEDQQSDFMAAEFGGPNLYGGRFPDGAHQHLFITDAHFELRQELLAETLIECGVPEPLRERWLAVDRRFKKKIVKTSIDDCKKRYTKDTILTAPNP